MNKMENATNAQVELIRSLRTELGYNQPIAYDKFSLKGASRTIRQLKFSKRIKMGV
jgi:hypothetical protein